MTFKLRRLTDFEVKTFNFGALGIALPRIPPNDWMWAIDESREALFTQLVSSSNEMRDDYYVYLLLVRGNPALVRFDRRSAETARGERQSNVIIEKFRESKDSTADLVRSLASEAQLLLFAHHNPQASAFLIQ